MHSVLGSLGRWATGVVVLGVGATVSLAGTTLPGVIPTAAASTAASTASASAASADTGLAGAGSASTGSASTGSASTASGAFAKTGTGPVTFNYNDNVKPGTITVAVTGITRQGPFARVGLTARCDTPGGCDATPFEGADSTRPLGTVEMIDPHNQQFHLPVEDNDGNQLVSAFPAYEMGYHHTYKAWITFAAPPTTDPDVEIALPDAGAQILDVAMPSRSTSWKPPVRAGKFDQPATSTKTSDLLMEVGPVSGQSNPGIEGQATHGTTTTVTLSADVLFAFDSATLTPAAKQALSGVAKDINTSGKGTVTVTGYTDSVGTEAYNMTLSQRRAQAVVDALQPLNDNSSVTFQAIGKGDADPVAPNRNPDGTDNPAGRQQNRRVTISYQVDHEVEAAPVVAPNTQTAAGATTFTIPNTSSTDDDNPGDETYKVTATTRRVGKLTEVSGTVTCVSTTENDPCGTMHDFSEEDSTDTADGINLVNYQTGTTYYPAVGSTQAAGGTLGRGDGAGFGFSLDPGGTESYFNWYVTDAPGQLAVEFPNGGPTIKQ